MSIHLGANPAELKQVMYQAVDGLMSTFIASTPKNSENLRLMYASVLVEKINQKWMAAYQLQRILPEPRVSYAVKVSVRHLIKQIEKELQEFEMVNSQQIGVDAANILSSQKYHEELREVLSESAKLHLLLWNELCQEKPSGNKIQNTGFQLMGRMDKIRECVVLLTSSQNSNFKTLSMVARYLRFVLQDAGESRKLALKLDNIRTGFMADRKFVDEKRLRFYDNVSPCIVLVSGNEDELGIVRTCNGEFLRTLGLDSQEILGELIGKIMPLAFAENHNRWMSRYFHSNEDSVMNSERKIIALDSKGFMIACTLLIKVLPTMRKGIEVIGIFSKVPEPKHTACKIIFDANTGEVLASTEACYRELGVHPALSYGHERRPRSVGVLEFFPFLTSLEEIVSNKWLNTEQKMDTSFVKEFHLNPKNTKNKEGSPSDKYNTYTKHSVKFEASPVLSYGLEDFHICVLTIDRFSHPAKVDFG